MLHALHFSLRWLQRLTIYCPSCGLTNTINLSSTLSGQESMSHPHLGHTGFFPHLRGWPRIYSSPVLRYDRVSCSCRLAESPQVSLDLDEGFLVSLLVLCPRFYFSLLQVTLWSTAYVSHAGMASSQGARSDIMPLQWPLICDIGHSRGTGMMSPHVETSFKNTGNPQRVVLHTFNA